MLHSVSYNATAKSVKWDLFKKKIQFIHPRRCKPNYRFSVVLVALICLHLQKVSSSVYLSSPWLTSAVQSTTNNGLVHFLAIVKSLIIYHLLIVRKQCYCSTQSAGIYSLSMTPFIYCEYLKTFFLQRFQWNKDLVCCFEPKISSQIDNSFEILAYKEMGTVSKSQCTL